MKYLLFFVLSAATVLEKCVMACERRAAREGVEEVIARGGSRGLIKGAKEWNETKNPISDSFNRELSLYQTIDTTEIFDRAISRTNHYLTLNLNQENPNISFDEKTKTIVIDNTK